MNSVTASVLILLAAILTSCSSSQHKIIVDSTKVKPEWANESKLRFEKDGSIYFKGEETVRGDQRLGGCYDLASFEVRSGIVRELKEELKGMIDQVMPDISESSESIMSKVSTSKWEGMIRGLKEEERYFERFRLLENSGSKNYKERVNCQVLLSLKEEEYQQMKMNAVEALKAVDPKLKEAIMNKQIDFLSAKKQ